MELEHNTIKDELNGITKCEEKIDRNDLKYKTNKHIFDLEQFQTKRSFEDSIFDGEITTSKADKKTKQSI